MNWLSFGGRGLGSDLTPQRDGCQTADECSKTVQGWDFKPTKPSNYSDCKDSFMWHFLCQWSWCKGTHKTNKKWCSIHAIPVGGGVITRSASPEKWYLRTVAYTACDSHVWSSIMLNSTLAKLSTNLMPALFIPTHKLLYCAS